MTVLMDIIKERRSIRKYEDKEVSDEQLNRVFESIRWAPSWANTQCWEIIVVKEPEIKEQLQGLSRAKNPSAKAMIQAPVVFVVCVKLQSSGYYKGQVTKKFGDWFMFDLGIACQNLCLTAYRHGLGTVIVGLYDHQKAGEILKVPQGYEQVVLIPMGYPAKISTAPTRREVAEFIHHNTF